VPQLNYERWGSGPPLVLLHGIGHRLQAWDPVLDRLAAAHDVIAVDLPGFGKSPPLDGQAGIADPAHCHPGQARTVYTKSQSGGSLRLLSLLIGCSW
jgi:pimeloyl-ACP methyl ester carboxylesterase